MSAGKAGSWTSADRNQTCRGHRCVSWNHSRYHEFAQAATLKLAVKLNPDLELVMTDEAKGEITIRDKKSGEVTTLSFDEMSMNKLKR